MRCSVCRAENPATAKFCGSCGAPLTAACAQCGHHNHPTARYCTECGCSLATAATESRLASPHSYTPRQLQDAILANRAAIEGGRKLVTVLFADVAGFTPLAARLGPEETHAVITRCVDLMHAEVDRYEGIVAQFRGDGILALFGAPIAHEDHAHRAVRAALGIQQVLGGHQQEVKTKHGVDFRVRIGLNSGPVAVGTIGTDLQMTYTASGDTVNLGARLQELAEPGAVVVGHDTHRLIAGYFVTRDLGAHQVKGKDEPVRAYEVLRPNRWRSRVDVYAERGLSPFVGRGRELELLLERFADARAGRGQVVLVRGEPGIGKSRLVHELKRRLEGEALTWLEGRCITYGYDIAYYPIVDLLKDNFQIEESDDEAEIIRKVDAMARALGDEVTTTAPYLKYLLAVDPGDPAVATMDAQLRKVRIFEALRALTLAGAAIRPLVLVLEDIHWIDELSEQFLSYLADALPDRPILLVVTYRSDYQHRLGARPAFTQLDLQHLSEQHSAAIAQGILGIASLPDELRALISRKAEGNPFFVEEVVKSLVEVGALRRSGDEYVLARPVEEIYVPDTLQAVIMARLDRLSDEPKRALQTAAVIGREFTIRLLERTAELRGQLDAYLRELKQIELIVERTLYPELAFMFKHALTHDVAYDSLLLARRKQLHRLVGEAIEALYGDRLAEHAETLAYHFERAEAWEKALDYLVESATKATKRFALPEALGYSDRALAAADRRGAAVPVATLLALRGMRADLFFSLGDFARSRAEAEAAIELARGVGDHAAEGSALGAAGLAVLWAEDFDAALAFARQALALGRTADLPGALAAGHFVTGYIYAVTARLDEARAELGETLAHSRSVGDRAHESLSLGVAGISHQWQGTYDVAIDLIDQSLHVAREHGVLFPWTLSLFTRGIVLTARGEYDAALATLNDGLTLVEKTGDEAFVPRFLNTLGWLHGECVDLDRAVGLDLVAAERFRQRRHATTIEGVAFALINLGDAFMVKGDLALAREALEEPERIVRDTRTHAWMKWRYEMHLYVSLGELALALGELAAAEVNAARCLEIAARTTSRKYLVRAWRLQGEIALARREWAAAAGHLRQALAMAEAIRNPPQLWKTQAALGRLHLARQHQELAGRAYAAAQQVVDQTIAAIQHPGLRAGLERAALTQEIRAGAVSG